MTTEVISLLNFNRGLVSRYGLSRLDIERIENSADLFTNIMPYVLGRMGIRSGLIYTGSGTLNNKKAYHIPFIYDNNDVGVFEFTDNNVAFKVGDAHINRDSVLSAITNGDFTSDISGWTDNSDTAGSSSYASGGYMELSGNSYDAGSVYQVVSVSGSDNSVKHGLRLKVERGSVTVNVGITLGAGDYIDNLVLTEGSYSLAFTPTAGDIYIQLSSKTKYKSLVDSVSIDSSGLVFLPTNIAEADIKYLRSDQIEDIVYIACRGYRPFAMVRYGASSFGLVYSIPDDGPFNLINIDQSNQISTSALSGDVTLTSNQGVFKSGDVGSLLKMDSSGQNISGSLNGSDQWVSEIRVSGVQATRRFEIGIGGTWSGTVRIQRSVDEKGSWATVHSKTANTSEGYTDSLDNQIVYYRIGFGSGDYSSGTANVSLEYTNGSIAGICRIVGFTDKNSVSAIVLKDFGGGDLTPNWYRGEWSGDNGYPSGVSLHEGRLTYGGLGKSFSSVSEAYESFDSDIEGDSRSFTKNLPITGSFDINGMLSLGRLFFATDLKEVFLRSSSFSEPLTPSNSAFKSPSSFGSTFIDPVIIDDSAFVVQRSGERVLKVEYSLDKDDYYPEDITKLIPEWMVSKVVRLAVQRMPDTRMHCVMGDGSVMIYIHDTLEDIKSWVRLETDGLIEDAYTLPNEKEDIVYYCIKRTINGVEKRYIEKMAFDRDCEGGSINYLADSCVLYDGASTNTISGLDHLEGEGVIVWGNNKDLSLDENDISTSILYTVSSGSITLPESVTTAVVGLPYRGRWRGSRFNPQTVKGASLLQRQKIRGIGFAGDNIHASGIRYGSDFINMDNLPLDYDGEFLGLNDVVEEYASDMFSFDGVHSVDTRLCLEMIAPRPCSISSVVLEVEMNEKGANR